MLSIEDRYYKLNRIILKVLGMWPYRKSKWNNVKMIMITTLYLSAIFVQFAVLVTHDYTFELLINVLSFALPSIVTLFMYHIYYFRANEFKNVMDHMYYDWKSLRNKMEVDILDDYACTAKLMIKIFTFIFFIIASDVILVNTTPLLLDVFLPLNESRKLNMPIQVEYFVSQLKYNKLFVLHMSTFACLGMLTNLASTLTIYSYGLHACGVFKITNYRIKMMVNKDVLRIPSPERERIIFKRLICAVNLHRRNILFCDMFMGQLDRLYLVLVGIIVAALSICMFRFLQAITAYSNIQEISSSFVLILYHILFLFFTNHFGLQITNNNAEIFDTVYKLQWYAVSLNIQKLVLFLLQIGYKDVYISISIFNTSYETFTTFMTSAVSYFTVLYTVR